MKTLAILGVLGIHLAFGGAFAQRTDREIRNEYRDYLIELGFEDYPAQMQERLARHRNRIGPLLTDLQVDVLTHNSILYQIFPDARDLAAEIFLAVEQDPARFKKSDNMYRLIRLTAEALAIQPIDPPRSLPEEIQSEEAATDYYHKLGVTNATMQSEVLTWEILKVLYGEKRLKELQTVTGPEKDYFNARLTKIRNLAFSVYQTAYTNSEMGQTRYFGRAMLASLMKYADKDPDTRVEERIRRVLQFEYKIRIENYLSDEIIVEDAKGKLVTIKIANGDTIMERSSGKEAGQIGWAVRPAWQNFWGGFRNFVLGHWFDQVVAVDEVDTKDMGWFKFGVYKLKSWLGATRFATRGLSHVGWAIVKQALMNRGGKKKSKMVWGGDSYPNTEEGGSRLIGVLENFALRGEFIRLAVSHYDAKALLRFAKEQMAKGYPKVAWVGNDPVTGEKKNYKVKISEAKWRELHSMPEEQAEEYLIEVMRLAVDFYLKEMLIENPFAFDHGFKNEYGRFYCSLAKYMMVMQATGLSTVKYPDKLNIVLRAAKWFGSKKVSDLNMEDPVIAPASDIWHSELTERVTIVSYQRMTQDEVELSGTRPPKPPSNPRMFFGEYQILLAQAKAADPNVSFDLNENLETAFEKAIAGEARKISKRAEAGRFVSGAQRATSYMSRCYRNIQRFVRQNL